MKIKKSRKQRKAENLKKKQIERYVSERLKEANVPQDFPIYQPINVLDFIGQSIGVISVGYVCYKKTGYFRGFWAGTADSPENAIQQAYGTFLNDDDDTEWIKIVFTCNGIIKTIEKEK